MLFSDYPKLQNLLRKYNNLIYDNRDIYQKLLSQWSWYNVIFANYYEHLNELNILYKQFNTKIYQIEQKMRIYTSYDDDIIKKYPCVSDNIENIVCDIFENFEFGRIMRSDELYELLLQYYNQSSSQTIL